MRSRLVRRLPPVRRVIAALGAGATAAALVALLNGPWLRVGDVAWEGERYTSDGDVAAVLAAARGTSLLALETSALTAALERLPAVADASVEAFLPGRVEARLVERVPAFVWQTSSARLVGAADGTLFAAFPPDAGVPQGLAALPVIDDQRRRARLMTVGDEIPAGYLEVTARLTAVDAAALGSSAAATSVRLDDTYGFQLVAGRPGWRIAFGFYEADPRAPAGDAGERVDDQVTAVRTLFAEEPETGIEWVDARNPGKVYFRAKG
jgi:cell division septal protein FtsQ